MPKPQFSYYPELKLRLSLSINACLLCSLVNEGENPLIFHHSPFSQHTQLIIFNEHGESLPFQNRVSAHPEWYEERDEPEEMQIRSGQTLHISHSKFIEYEEGCWRLNWGWQVFENIPKGIYSFVIHHPQVRPSDLVTFEIPPSMEDIENALSQK
ncbi:MAG: hypothetical protein D6820_14150 [Lentisphaerae bacterium]|nr:MAG: hypothetical protein D6820_14150 [Lentisphaerota bacterium]